MLETTTHPTWEQRLWGFLGTWWQQIAITQAGIYLVASFGSSHGILPAPAAWILAIGMEGTYLKGLVDAGHVRGRGQGWATALIVGTYVTVICWGIAYILGLPAVGVIPEHLGPGWGGAIAAIHVLPIAFTGLCSALLHKARAGEEATLTEQRRQFAEARERQLQQQRDAEAEAERVARRQLELELERKRAELALWEQAQHTKAQLRAQRPDLFANSRTTSAFGASGTATNSRANSADEHLCAQVVAALAADPRANRSQLARDLGVGRTKLYALIRNAQQRGELPTEDA